MACSAPYWRQAFARRFCTQVEQYFIGKGYLIPVFHKAYWLGLTTQKTGGRPNWYWMEPNAMSPTDDESFKHWGMYQVGLPVDMGAPWGRALTVQHITCFLKTVT
jgi:hypothetical protein